MARVSKETAATHRSAIVRAASRLFRARGLDGVGVAEITKAAGLTHGGFYGHFASKEALAAEAVTAAFEEGRARLETHGLDGWLRGYLSRSHRDRPDEGCPLLAFPAQSGREPSEVAEALGSGAARLIAALAERVPVEPDEGTEESIGGEARARRAVEILATAIGGQMLARALASADPTLSDSVLRALREHLEPLGRGRAAPRPCDASAKG